MINNVRSFKTNEGWITIEENGGKILSCKFKKTINYGIQNKLKIIESEISKFMSGKKTKWSFPFKQRGTPLQEKVWNEMSKIPFGKTKTYKDIAVKLKTSPRVVGIACGKNNILLIVPCHRVVRTDGGLGGYAAPLGIKTKRNLLLMENPKNIFK